MDRRVMNRVGALAGLAGVAGNIVGVATLGDIPSAYRPGTIAAWAREVLAAPDAAAASAIGFTLGLIALAGWALIFAARLETPLARTAGVLIAIGALFDAAGTPAQLVVGTYLGPACGSGADCLRAAIGLLGMSLAFDALFNLLLGIGLVLFAGAMWNRLTSMRWLAPLLLVAGIASIPVSLQVTSDAAARLLIVAGPLWLVAIAASSVLLWRGRL